MSASLIFFLTLASLTGYAQSETYDIVTFTPPSGWKKEFTENKISYSAGTNGGQWCRIAVYKNIDSKGSVEKDFENDWRELIVKPLKVKDAPASISLAAPEGWKRKTGGAIWMFNETKASVILSTMTGYGKEVSFLIMTNSKEFGKEIDNFLSAFRLAVPAVSVSESVPTKDEPPLTTTWQKRSSAFDEKGLSAYSKEQYIFNKDGTYVFYSKAYSTSDTSIYFVRETGLWKARGNNLLVSPLKSNVESWSKKNGGDQYGDHMNSRPRLLEKITYQYERHFFPGPKEWSLILTAKQKTQRDGQYSTNPQYPKSWLFSPITETYPIIDLPEDTAPFK